MKIKSIKAFAITNPTMGGAYSARPENEKLLRRPPWTKDAEVANPMSRYPRYKRLRASWLGNLPAVGCLVTADDGAWGFGTTSCGNAVIGVINDHLGPLLVDENPLATEKIFDMAMRMASPYSPSGLAAYAISAIDLALWDLKGRVLKLPVYELAGGPARERQYCYATGNDTDWHLELGFTATKLACPYGTADGLAAIDGNEEFVAKARQLIGPKVELMLDCWMAFDVEFAVRLAERLRPYGLRWIEDCLQPEDLDGQSELRRRLPWQTLATGEHWYTPTVFAAAAARRSADILQPDIAWAGGMTACLKICSIAEAVGIAVIPHAGMNTPYGQHFGYAMPNAPLGEFFIGTPPGVPLKETRLFPGMAVPRNGRLMPSDEPGFGLGAGIREIEAMRV